MLQSLLLLAPLLAGFEPVQTDGARSVPGQTPSWEEKVRGAKVKKESQTSLLADLTVTGTDVFMSPAYTTTRSRYAVYPGATTTGIFVTATTSASAFPKVLINRTPVQSGVSHFIPSPVKGDEIVIEAFSPTGSERFELIYLADDFPFIEVSILEPGVSDGYLYITPSGAGPTEAVIIDNEGVPVFLRDSPRSAAFTQHPNGLRSYGERIGRPVPDRCASENPRTWPHVILGPDFQEIERLEVVAPLLVTGLHEFLFLPNGNHTFISYETLMHNGQCYIDSVIQEVDPAGTEVFHWNSWGHIPLADQLSTHPIDYAHMNSVFLDDDGNYLVSLRATSQIVKINRTTGAVMWKLGGLSNQFTIIDPLGGPCGQHHAQRLPNGNILFFDNGQYCPPSYPARGETSRAVEYELDEVNLTATLVWDFSQPGGYAPFAGSAQRLPNGNTLIGYGGRPNDMAVTEVDPSGTVVLEMRFIDGSPDMRGSYRVLRFDD